MLKTDMLACQATHPIVPSACFAFRAVGESCSSYLDGQDCESLVCQPDALDRWRCAVRPTESCLNRIIDFLRAAFLCSTKAVWLLTEPGVVTYLR
jgi:hypothetical protein